MTNDGIRVTKKENVLTTEEREGFCRSSIAPLGDGAADTKHGDADATKDGSQGNPDDEKQFGHVPPIACLLLSKKRPWAPAPSSPSRREKGQSTGPGALMYEFKP